MNFKEAPEFQKELKTYAKKWRSLPSDLKRAQKIIEQFYANGIILIELFSKNDKTREDPTRIDKYTTDK